MKISIDLKRFKTALDEKQAQIQAATRPAAQAGVQVIYDQARLNVPVSGKGHWFHGTSFKKNGQKYWFTSGSLRDSIYQVFSQDKSNAHKATYHVSWNRKKAPYAWMVELGTSRAAARPFLAPAIAGKADEARREMRRVFIEKVKSP